MNEITHIPIEIARRKDNFPYPAPFILSSMERWLCCKDEPNLKTNPEFVVYIKRRHLEENLKTIEREIGMNEVERGKFLDYWCCHAAGSAEVRAERDEYFDLRYRAENWMKRAAPAEPNQSRVEKYADTSKKISMLIHGYIGNNADTTAGAPVPPDEQ